MALSILTSWLMLWRNDAFLSALSTIKHTWLSGKATGMLLYCEAEMCDAYIEYVN